MSNNCCENLRIAHLQLVTISVVFVNTLVPRDNLNNVLPEILKTSLSSHLLDFSFMSMYPDVHKKLLHIVKVCLDHYVTFGLDKTFVAGVYF